jgi:hypothetical protein
VKLVAPVPPQFTLKPVVVIFDAVKTGATGVETLGVQVAPESELRQIAPF